MVGNKAGKPRMIGTPSTLLWNCCNCRYNIQQVRPTCWPTCWQAGRVSLGLSQGTVDPASLLIKPPQPTPKTSRVVMLSLPRARPENPQQMKNSWRNVVKPHDSVRAVHAIASDTARHNLIRNDQLSNDILDSLKRLLHHNWQQKGANSGWHMYCSPCPGIGVPHASGTQARPLASIVSSLTLPKFHLASYINMIERGIHNKNVPYMKDWPIGLLDRRTSALDFWTADRWTCVSQSCARTD